MDTAPSTALLVPVLNLIWRNTGTTWEGDGAPGITVQSDGSDTLIFVTAFERDRNDPSPLDSQVAARIVACLNAMRGIEDPMAFAAARPRTT